MFVRKTLGYLYKYDYIFNFPQRFSLLTPLIELTGLTALSIRLLPFGNSVEVVCQLQ